MLHKETEVNTKFFLPISDFPVLTSSRKNVYNKVLLSWFRMTLYYTFFLHKTSKVILQLPSCDGYIIDALSK